MLVSVPWNSAFGQLGEQFSWLLPWVSLLRHSEADIRIEDLLQAPPPSPLSLPQHSFCCSSPTACADVMGHGQSVEGHKANKARRSIPAIVRDVIAQPGNTSSPSMVAVLCCAS